VHWLWVPFTLAAALAQVLRNAVQSRLSARIGTLGGTQVRFVFGLPFALLLFALLWGLTGEQLPMLSRAALGWALLGGIAQIVATALMLAVMGKRDFGVAYAYIKTEPVTVAIMGLILLGDRLPALGWIAVIVVTCGVILASLRKDDGARRLAEFKPMLVGVGSGALFGLSAIAFRGAIDAVPQGSFMMRSLLMLVVSLSIQTAILGAWFAARDLAPFLGSLREWRLSLIAGALSALASAGWFIAFSLSIAANVRTLSLIEMPVVALVSRRLSGHWLSGREAAGFVLITGGVALLLLAHGA
jgi:drug/metabolite transporter (DMT)-like permease